VDVIDLYCRDTVGTKIVVMPSRRSPTVASFSIPAGASSSRTYDMAWRGGYWSALQ